MVVTSLAGTNLDKVFGAIVNTNELRLSLPDWTMLVYVSDDVPIYIVHKLLTQGARVRRPDKRLQHLAPAFWKYSILGGQEANKVDVVVMREANWRLTVRDTGLISSWLEDEAINKPVMCVKDGISPAEPVWAVTGKVLRHGSSLLDNMVSHLNSISDSDDQAQMNSVWDKVLWPQLQDQSICYDIMSQPDHRFSHKMPKRFRTLSDSIVRIGQAVDAFDTLPSFLNRPNPQ